MSTILLLLVHLWPKLCSVEHMMKQAVSKENWPRSNFRSWDNWNSRDTKNKPWKWMLSLNRRRRPRLLLYSKKGNAKSKGRKVLLTLAVLQITSMPIASRATTLVLRVRWLVWSGVSSRLPKIASWWLYRFKGETILTLLQLMALPPRLMPMQEIANHELRSSTTASNLVITIPTQNRNTKVSAAPWLLAYRATLLVLQPLDLLILRISTISLREVMLKTKGAQVKALRGVSKLISRLVRIGRGALFLSI